MVCMIVWFKPFSGPSAQRKLSTARSFNNALGLNATVPGWVRSYADS
jgi:hypothetical protein